MIERALRWMAIAIATLALIDPPLTLSGPGRARVSLMTSGGGEAAASVQRMVSNAISRDFDVVDGLDPSANAIVVIGDRYPDESIEDHANVSTVSLSPPDEPRVAIRRIVAPRAVPPATAVRLGVDVASSRMEGKTSRLVVRTGGALLTSRTHTWNSSPGTWHEDLDAMPVGAGPILLDVAADESHAVMAVDIAPRMRVLVVESRPSWASAFVRRAIESDPRFDISGVSSPSTGKVVTSGSSPALPEDLRSFDAILLGGLDRLPETALSVVERFVRERGGVLILVPDQALPKNLAQRLIPGVALRESLLAKAAALDVSSAPRLDASELLEATGLPESADVLARSPSSHLPVVWSVGAGEGRIVVSGALDAWRYRGSADDAFTRFWRSLIAGAALDARPAVAVVLSPRRAAPGDRVRVTARVRALERGHQGNQLAIGARVGDEAVRLWPDATPGTFVGTFIVGAHGASPTRLVSATLADGGSGTARLTIDRAARPTVGPPLSWLARAHNGIDVSASSIDALVRHLGRTINPASVPLVRHPMRSAWWFAPFAVCLSIEWWSRRRRGAR